MLGHPLEGLIRFMERDRRLPRQLPLTGTYCIRHGNNICSTQRLNPALCTMKRYNETVRPLTRF